MAPPFEYQLDARGIQEHLHVVEGIAVHHNHVGQPPLLDRAELALEPEALGRPLGGGAERLHGVRPASTRYWSSSAFFGVTVAASIGAGGDTARQLDGPPHAGHVVRVEVGGRARTWVRGFPGGRRTP